MNANPDQDFVLKTIKSRDVHFVRCWFTDILGNLKSFAVIPHDLEEAFQEGLGFDGACIEGFQALRESDLRAYPDASTFQILPWRPESDAVARMFCSIRTARVEPFKGDSRNILMRVIDKAAKMGFIFNVCPEPEFYYFRNSESADVLDSGGYFDLTSLDYGSDLRRDTVLTLEKLGIPVEYSHHERGPSQHEIDLRYSDGLSMADALMTYKLVVKEIAMKNGVYASFMPKPLSNEPGNGMHIHQSLFDHEGKNIFFDAEARDRNYLSKTAENYLAGLLKYAPEYTMVTNQYTNSYKRLVSDEDAPLAIAWSHTNRTSLIRVPPFKTEKESSCRIELRSPDPAANPYLAFAVVLAAGLKGIELELPLQDPNEEEDLNSLSNECLEEHGLTALPNNLGEALERFKHSALMKEVLGEHTHSYLVEAKGREWNSYQRDVSQWEQKRFLSVL